jgi:hypothetical protein
MEITIVTTEEEREEYKKTLDARCAFISNKITREQWENFPKKVWVDLVNQYGSTLFIVVDNQDSNCFVEEFQTLDGALLYATDCKLTTEDQEDWDYMGALRECRSKMPRSGFSQQTDPCPARHGTYAVRFRHYRKAQYRKGE